jgi:threonine/homoserine/homoserine lactone efflux protein
MELSIYLAFVVATTIMIALPGPSVLLTVAHGISFGGRRALFTVAGATAGIAVQLGIAAIGLASLLNIVAEAFVWLRWAGAAYLVYLGIKQWISARTATRFEASSGSTTNLFSQGLVTTILNPKSLIFIAAFLPQFIDTTQPVGVQFAVIVPTFLGITFAVTSIWALLAGKVSGLLKSQRAVRSVLRTGGALTIATGAGLALARRGS